MKTATKIQGMLVILGTTLVGFAGGVFFQRATEETPARRMDEEGRRFPRDSFGAGRRSPMPRVFDQLDLTDAQRTSIDSIFRAWEPRTEAVMNELLPRIEALRDTVRIEIDAILTPEQVEKLREMPQFRRNRPPPFRVPRGDDGRRTPQRNR